MNEVCCINKKTYPKEKLVIASSLRKPLLDFIQQENPEVNEASSISFDALQEIRKKYIEQLLREQIGDLSEAEKDVLGSISQNEILSENIDVESDKTVTTAEKLADKVASFGGSWTFIILFFFLLLMWMGINIVWLRNRGFDPYPFILLNLVLSCVAAMQAPIIMMSQNRKDAKDRARNEHDYKINLKAELEIRLLHEKIDHILLEQNQRLLEIQNTQNDMLVQMEMRK